VCVCEPGLAQQKYLEQNKTQFDAAYFWVSSPCPPVALSSCLAFAPGVFMQNQFNSSDLLTHRGVVAKFVGRD